MIAKVFQDKIREIVCGNDNSHFVEEKLRNEAIIDNTSEFNVWLCVDFLIYEIIFKVLECRYSPWCTTLRMNSPNAPCVLFTFRYATFHGIDTRKLDDKKNKSNTLRFRAATVDRREVVRGARRAHASATTSRDISTAMLCTRYRSNIVK